MKKSSRRMSVLGTAGSAAVALMLGASGAARAADTFWSGLYPLSADFSNAANWQVFFVPGSGDRATFSAAAANSPSFGSGTVTIDQLVISTHLTDANFSSQPYWDFYGTASNENLKVNTDVTLTDIGSGATLFADGLDITTPITYITNNTGLHVGGSATYTSQLNLSGSGTFTVDNGNTIRGLINFASSGNGDVYGLLDSNGFGISGGGYIAIKPTGNLFINQNSSVTNGMLFVDSGAQMSMTFGSVLSISGSAASMQITSNFAMPNNTKLNVNSGGDVVAVGFMDLGNGNGGSMTVDGAGSSVNAGSTSDWGATASGSATVDFTNGGAGNYSNLRIGLTNGSAAVRLLSSGQLTTSSSLQMGGAGSHGTLSLTVNGGTLNNNGTSAFNNGALVSLVAGGINFNGDGTFNAGSTLNWSGGGINIASGKTLSVTGGIINDTAGGHALSNGATIRVNAGGQFINNSFYDIANGSATGTLLIDGAGSKFTALSTSDWGDSPGNNATVSISNSGMGSYTNVRMSNLGGAATLNLQTSGVLNVGVLQAGFGTGSTALSRVNISGGTLNTTGPSSFLGGANVALSSGGWAMNADSTFSTGSNLNWTGGNLGIASGKTLTFSGGTGTLAASTGLANGATIRVTNGGQVFNTTYLDIANSSVGGATGTLAIDGAGSKYAQTSDFTDLGFISGDSGTLTVANSGAASFNNGLFVASAGKAFIGVSGGSLSINNFGAGGAATSVATINISGGSFNSVTTAGFANGATVNVTGSGVLALGGNSTFSAGSTLNALPFGAVSLTPNTTLAFDGGIGAITGVFNGLQAGETIKITNGGQLTAQALNLALVGGNATLLVDGAASKYFGTAAETWGQSSTATVTFSNGGAGTINGNLQMGSVGGQALVNITSGGLLQATSIDTSFSGGSATFNVNGGTLRTTGDLNLWGTATGGATINYAAGTVNVGGTLGVGFNGPAKVLLTTGGNKVLRVGAVSITSTGKIDLADNDMIVDYSGATPLSTVRGFLLTGRNGGNWAGNGITSSSAALDASHKGIGIGEASAVLGPSGGTFSGQTVDGTAVLLKYTWLGDANLDGQVDVTDLGALATHWQTSSVWTGGDFNYDGFVDVTDLGLLATNWQAGVGNPLGPGSFDAALATVGLGGTTVPEPGALFGVGLSLCALRRRRRD